MNFVNNSLNFAILLEMWKMIRNIYKAISSPKIFVYTVLWLMVLVFFGTLAQKDIGLYASQMKYFSSFYFLFYDFIPLPGGRLTLTLMTINLGTSLFKRNLWKIKKIGVIILHIGGLLLLLGGGVTASNHAYQGEPAQIGWFNAINTNLGIDSGIVMCTGDIYALDPVVGSGFPILPNTVTDPDLLTVANSVPGMIGQSFSVSSINDVATLEFDFIPTSDSLDFRYVFGSQEYFAWENTSYNDVFGFFLSGPGIAGPWSNGAINLAVVPNTTPPLPITISSINSVTPINQQYFVDNQNGLGVIADADGFTTVLTARALVQCGEVYHIRLTIADGSDQGLSSYVWLEAGSFSSPLLEVVDDLGIDSTTMNIPCNSSIILTADGGVGASYQWFDSTATVIGTDSFLVAGPGTYWIEASSFGCPVMSDTLRVIAEDSPSFDFGLDSLTTLTNTGESFSKK